MAERLASKALAEYREDRYLSVREFADLLEVSVDTLYRIQNGERPRPKTMRKIAEKLGVHPSEITEFARKPEARSN